MTLDKAILGVPEWPQGASWNWPQRRNDALDYKTIESVGFQALGFILGNPSHKSPLCANGHVRPSLEHGICSVRASAKFAQGGQNRPNTSRAVVCGGTTSTMV